MKQSITITSGMISKEPREVDCTIGEQYIVSPVNPRKEKHRGRICTIEEFDDEFAPQMASVRFQDTNRIGRVELADLIPAAKPFELPTASEHPFLATKPRADSEARLRRYWQVTPGPAGCIWNECKDGGLIAIRADGTRRDIGHLSFDELKETIRQQKAKVGKQTNPTQNANQCRDFLEISVGDIIVANRGFNRILGVGIVESGYRFANERSDYAHIREVCWLDLDEIQLPGHFSRDELFVQETVFELTDSRKNLVAIVNSEANIDAEFDNVEYAVVDDTFNASIRRERVCMRPVSRESLFRAKEKATEIGRKGEVLVDQHLAHLVATRKISGYQWRSSIDAISPFDFEIERLDGSVCRVEVKSTEGAFDRAFHLSTSELATAACEEVDFVIYRIFNLQDSGCSLCCSQNINKQAEAILQACDSLPPGVTIDGYSVAPRILSFGPVVSIVTGQGRDPASIIES